MGRFRVADLCSRLLVPACSLVPNDIIILNAKMRKVELTGNQFQFSSLNLKLDLYKEAISEDEEGCQSLQETSLGNEMNEQDGENMLVKLEDCSETQILTEEIDIKSIKDQEFKDRTELTHPIPAFFN